MYDSADEYGAKTVFTFNRCFSPARHQRRMKRSWGARYTFLNDNSCGNDNKNTISSNGSSYCISDYEEEAEQILNACQQKPIIALDLDHTLWPVHCSEQTVAPYKAVHSSTTTSTAETDTVHDVATAAEEAPYFCGVISCGSSNSSTVQLQSHLSLFPHVLSILQWCVNHNVILTICSRSPSYQQVQDILKAFGIWDWFLLPQIFNKRKSYHFRNLAECTGIPFENFLFFDDLPENVQLASQMGMSAVQVGNNSMSNSSSSSSGLDWPMFLRGLELFSSRQQQRQQQRQRNAEMNLRMATAVENQQRQEAKKQQHWRQEIVDNEAAEAEEDEDYTAVEDSDFPEYLSPLNEVAAVPFPVEVSTYKAAAAAEEALAAVVVRRPNSMAMRFKPPPLLLSSSHWSLYSSCGSHSYDSSSNDSGELPYSYTADTAAAAEEVEVATVVAGKEPSSPPLLPLRQQQGDFCYYSNSDSSSSGSFHSSSSTAHEKLSPKTQLGRPTDVLVGTTTTTDTTAAIVVDASARSRSSSNRSEDSSGFNPPAMEKRVSFSNDVKTFDGSLLPTILTDDSAIENWPIVVPDVNRLLAQIRSTPTEQQQQQQQHFSEYKSL